MEPTHCPAALYWHFWRRADLSGSFSYIPIIHPNSSPQARLPTRMNATLKVFIAFSPRLNRASPSNQPYENRFTSTQYRLYQGIPNHKSKKLAMVDDNEGLFVVGLNSLPTPHIWATVNIWYIAPSHHFLKSVLSFFRFWYISKCYRFLKSVLSFSKPQLNFKKQRCLEYNSPLT